MVDIALAALIAEGKLQTLMDLKERVEKLSDMCTDINNQVDDMIKTLNTYSASESGVLYMVAACSVDVVVRFFQLIIYAVSYAASVCPLRFFTLRGLIVVVDSVDIPDQALLFLIRVS